MCMRMVAEVGAVGGTFEEGFDAGAAWAESGRDDMFLRAELLCEAGWVSDDFMAGAMTGRDAALGVLGVGAWE